MRSTTTLTNVLTEQKHSLLLCSVFLTLNGCNPQEYNVPTSNNNTSVYASTKAYVDADGDGVRAAIDCDDTDASVGRPSKWYRDRDSDGYGTRRIYVFECTEPAGYVSNRQDCDDRYSTINPAASEYCNSVDDNCDRIVDEDTSLDAVVWYLDVDSDGYGDANYTTTACSAPTGYVSDATDCDDSTSLANPSLAEVCDDTYDNDCDGDVDSADMVDCCGTATSSVYLYMDGSLEATYTLPSFSGSMEIVLGSRNALYDNVQLVADCSTLVSEDFEVDAGCFDAGSLSSDGNPGYALSTGTGATYPQCSVSGFDPATQAWYLSFDSKPTSSTVEYETATGIQGTSSGMIQINIDTNASGSGDLVSRLITGSGSESFSFSFDSDWHTFVISNYTL